MSNKVKAYAEALMSSLDGVDEKEVKKRIVRFVELLKKHRDLKLASDIISEIQSSGESKNTVISARRLPKETKDRIEKLLESEVKEIINPNVIGGIALLLDNKFLIDGTIKRKIANIFS